MNEKLDSKTPATLATVKHGGCVQLPTSERARFEAWASAYGFPVAKTDGLYHSYTTATAWLAWQQAALSAQPSPGGQGNALVTDEMVQAACKVWAETPGQGEDWMQAALKAALAARQPETSHAAYHTDKAVGRREAELEARQPVGEPVAYIEHFADQLSRVEMTMHGLQLGIGKHAAYAAPPAQAVDLGRFREPVVQWKVAAERVIRCKGHAMAEEKVKVRDEAVRLLALIDSQA